MLQDRDALAVAFARENCKVNGVENAESGLRPRLPGPGGAHLRPDRLEPPGKSGQARPGELLPGHAAGCLSRTGTAAVVIVSPLADLAQDAIQSSGCLLFHAESTSQHSVSSISERRKAMKASAADWKTLRPTFGPARSFSSGDVDYELETAYNLPGFRHARLRGGAWPRTSLRRSVVQGRVLFWNPGQGHLPVFAQKRAGAINRGITLGRPRRSRAGNHRTEPGSAGQGAVAGPPHCRRGRPRGGM